MRRTDIDLGWAAGLFEGEGCISATSARPHQPHMTVTSTDRDVIERFKQIVGVGQIHHKPMPADKPHWTPALVWQATGAAAETAIRLLLPHLCGRRSERARVVLTDRAEHIARVTQERLCIICERPFRPGYHARSVSMMLCSRACAKQRNRDTTNARARLIRSAA